MPRGVCIRGLPFLQVEVKRLEEKLAEQKRAERSALDELVLKSNEVRATGQGDPAFIICAER